MNFLGKKIEHPCPFLLLIQSFAIFAGSIESIEIEISRNKRDNTKNSLYQTTNINLIVFDERVKKMEQQKELLLSSLNQTRNKSNDE